PDVALARDGTVVVAWSQQGSRGATIMVAGYDGTRWTGFGSSLAPEGIAGGGGDSTHPRMALDAANRPEIAWMVTQAARRRVDFRRWTGTAWEELAGVASGRGLSRALASTAVAGFDRDGRPVVAWSEGDEDEHWHDVYARAWSGLAWVRVADFAS